MQRVDEIFYERSNNKQKKEYNYYKKEIMNYHCCCCCCFFQTSTYILKMVHFGYFFSAVSFGPQLQQGTEGQKQVHELGNACQNNTIKNQLHCQGQLFPKQQVSWTAGKIGVDRRSRGCNQAHSRQSHEVNNNDPVIIEQAVSGRPSETHRLSIHYITNLPTNTDPNNQHSANSLIIVTNHNAT